MDRFVYSKVFEQLTELVESRNTYSTKKPEKGSPNQDRQCGTEPVVLFETKYLDIPKAVWGDPNFGTLSQIVFHLEEVNNIPDVANIEYDFDESSGILRLKYHWWAISFDSKVSYYKN